MTEKSTIQREVGGGIEYEKPKIQKKITPQQLCSPKRLKISYSRLSKKTKKKNHLCKTKRKFQEKEPIFIKREKSFDMRVETAPICRELLVCLVP